MSDRKKAHQDVEPETFYMNKNGFMVIQAGLVYSRRDIVGLISDSYDMNATIVFQQTGDVRQIIVMWYGDDTLIGTQLLPDSTPDKAVFYANGTYITIPTSAILMIVATSSRTMLQDIFDITLEDFDKTNPSQ
jgi:hypothetical protein